MQPAYDVAVERINGYDDERLTALLDKAICDVDGYSFITPGITVGIKANLVCPAKPERAATTHPALIDALCRLLLNRGVGKIIIGDSPGGLYNHAYLANTYNITGIKALESENVKCNTNFNSVEITFENGKILKHFTGTEWLQQVDATVNFCKLKTHGMMGMSAAVKNLFGTIPGAIKAEYHNIYDKYGDFADMLIDLNEYWKPALCLCDAVTAMEGNGPTAGTPRKVGAIIASKSPYALDYVAAKIIGLTPDFLPTLQTSINRGLVEADFSKISVAGNIDEFLIPDYNNIATKKSLNFDNFGIGPFTTLICHLGNKLLRSKPNPNTDECIGCGKCVEVCPVKAVKLINKKAVINRKMCIKCFCCQEFCPIGAMKVKRPLIGRIITR